MVWRKLQIPIPAVPELLQLLPGLLWEGIYSQKKPGMQLPPGLGNWSWNLMENTREIPRKPVPNPGFWEAEGTCGRVNSELGLDLGLTPRGSEFPSKLQFPVSLEFTSQGFPESFSQALLAVLGGIQGE